MEDVSVAHAKEHLEELVARAARGEDVGIVDPKVGKVKLTLAGNGASRPRKPRRLGLLEGRITPPARLLEPMTRRSLRTGTVKSREAACGHPCRVLGYDGTGASVASGTRSSGVGG